LGKLSELFIESEMRLVCRLYFFVVYNYCCSNFATLQEQVCSSNIVLIAQSAIYISDSLNSSAARIVVAYVAVTLGIRLIL